MVLSLYRCDLKVERRCHERMRRSRRREEAVKGSKPDTQEERGPRKLECGSWAAGSLVDHSRMGSTRRFG